MKHFVRATTVSGLRYSGICGGVDDCVFQNLVSSKSSFVSSHRSNAASVTIWTRSPELRSVHIQTFTVSTDSSWLFSLVSSSLLPVVVYSRQSDTVNIPALAERPLVPGKMRESRPCQHDFLLSFSTIATPVARSVERSHPLLAGLSGGMGRIEYAPPCRTRNRVYSSCITKIIRRAKLGRG